MGANNALIKSYEIDVLKQEENETISDLRQTTFFSFINAFSTRKMLSGFALNSLIIYIAKLKSHTL